MSNRSPGATTVPDAPFDRPRTLPGDVRLGTVHLTVADAEVSTAWYRHALGLRVHAQEQATVTLGDGARALVVLHEDPLATPAGAHVGLYHYAINFPSRGAFARAAVRLTAARVPIAGATEHPRHDGIYLSDPDGNGIELAWDHASGHAVQGRSPTGRSRLDLEALLVRGRRTELGEHVDEGTRIGHLHLVVGDIDEALAFYRDLLGFDEGSRMGGFAFLAVGGYHHHLAFNTGGRGGHGPAPERAAGLRTWTIELPLAADVRAVRSRLAHAGTPTRSVAGGFVAGDPWGIEVAVLAPSTAAAALN